MRLRPRVLALLLLAACGDDEFNGLPDGPVAPDTPEPDGPAAGLVTLTVTDLGLPRMGVKVYFQNADSSLVSATMTDVNGVASAVMEAGGFVTAIDPFPQRLPQGLATNELETFAGVKPLDELVLSRGRAQPASVNVTLSVAQDPNVSIGSYSVFAPCIQNGGLLIGSGSGSAPISGTIDFFGCAATTDLTIVVSDGTNLVSAAHVPNVTLADGDTLDLSAITYTAVEGASWQFTNVPAFVGSFSITDALASARGLQFVVFNEGGIDAGTGTTSTLQRPVIAGSEQIVLSNFSGAPLSQHTILDWGAPETAYSRSLTDVLLANYATTPAYDLATKTAAWTVDPGPAPDFAIVRTDLGRDLPAAQIWHWEIVAPLGTEPSVRYPVLPAPDDQFNPISTDGATVSSLTTAKAPGGYDTVRELALSVAGDPNTGLPLELVVGATGRVVSQDLFLPQAKPTRPFLPYAAKIQQTIKARRR